MSRVQSMELMAGKVGSGRALAQLARVPALALALGALGRDGLAVAVPVVVAVDPARALAVGMLLYLLLLVLLQLALVPL
jgi:hypothetical protein